MCPNQCPQWSITPQCCSPLHTTTRSTRRSQHDEKRHQETQRCLLPRGTTSSGASRKLSAKAASEVVFFPDAGSVRNINVLSDYFKTFKLLNDWGIPTCVAWWGQFPEGLADLVAQIVKVWLLHSDLLPTPVRAIDHRLAAKLQYAKSQLQELAAVHDAAELREAPACFQRVCSSFDTWP